MHGGGQGFEPPRLHHEFPDHQLGVRLSERVLASRQRSLEVVVGEIIVEIELENGEDRYDARRGRIDEGSVRRETITAVADVGGVMLELPEDVVKRLGLRTVSTVARARADGSRNILPVAGPLTIQIGDRQMTTDCIVVAEGAQAVVGRVVTMALDLHPDPVKQTLAPRPESPDRPLLRV